MKTKLLQPLLILAALGILLGAFLLPRSAKPPGNEVPSEVESIQTQQHSPTPPTNGATQLDIAATSMPGAGLAQFVEWQTRFSAAQNIEPAMLEEGRRLAEARRAEMLKLIRENPMRALEQSLAWNEWAALPKEIQALVEEPFSETGDFHVFSDCRPLEQRETPWQKHLLTMRGESYRAFVYGRRQEMFSKNGIPVQGIRLDGNVALRETTVQQVSEKDLSTVEKLFPNGNERDRSWLTGNRIANRPRAALMGGKLHYFETDEERNTVQATLAEAEQMIGPNTFVQAMAAASSSGPGGTFNAPKFKAAASAAKSAWTEQPKRVLAIRLDYTPSAGTPYTPNALANYLLVNSNSIREMSYGKTFLSNTVTPQIFQLPSSQQHYESPGSDLAGDALNLVTNAGYSMTNYDIFLYSFPPMNANPAWASIGGQHQWLNGSNAPITSIHEFGHNYGLDHAHLWENLTGSGFLGHLGQTSRTPSEWHDYGDGFDIMGYGSNVAHYSMFSKALLNWIEPSEVLNVTTSGTYRIRRFDHVQARPSPGTPLALCVKNFDGQGIWVGFRRNITNSASLRTGAYIIWADGVNWHHHLDATPLSQTNADWYADLGDAALPQGQSLDDPTGKFRITTLGWGGTAPFEYLDVNVTFTSNAPPFRLFTDFSYATPGLMGRYIDQNLWHDTRTNWNVLPGVNRLDSTLNFTNSNWGSRASVGLTSGTDADWDLFSVQWDGVIVVNRPMVLAKRSDDRSRMWIDLNGDGNFAPSGREFMNNQWEISGAQGYLIFSEPSVGLQPGAYRIRIQYTEGWGNNLFTLLSSDLQYEFFTDAALTTNGVLGTYINASLQGQPGQADWAATQPVAGRRIDRYPGYFGFGDWGQRAALNLNSPGGSDANWLNSSVQWDGYLRVHRPMRFSTMGIDGSRMWIDLNGNGAFSTTAPEYINNRWGQPSLGLWWIGDSSVTVHPGTYRTRIQFSAANSDDFILYGAPVDVPPAGGSGYALNFDGIDDYVALGVSGLLSGPRTYEAWVRPFTHEGLGMPIIAAGMPSEAVVLGVAGTSGGCNLGQYKLYLDQAGAGCIASSQSLTPNQWNHVALTYDGTTVRLYVNGVQGAFANRTLATIFFGSHTIGGSLVGGTSTQPSFYGQLDEVRIWTVARTAAEIAAAYHCSFPTNAPSLAANWHLDAGAGTSTADSSGNGRTATLVNGPTWVVSGTSLSSSLSTHVTNLADDGVGSLRQAICAALVLPGPNTVTFDASLSGGTIRLTSGQLAINDASPITIEAPPSGAIAVSGEGLQRVMQVFPGTTVTLNGLVISNGMVIAGSPARGGGIYNQGYLTVSNCTLAFNSVQNSSEARGGAISTQNGTVTAWNSTFYGNTLLSQNSYGGAIDCEGSLVTLRHCTFTINSAGTGSGTHFGGAIRLFNSALRLGHTIVARNIALSGPEILTGASSITSDGWNLLGDGTGSGLLHGVKGNQIGSSGSPIHPWLSPLRTNTSSMPVCLPIGGSPALDAGDVAFGGPPFTDQRGYPRVAGGRVDIGAVENCLRAYYSFDNSTIVDSVGTISNTAVIGCTPAWATDHSGRPGSAIDFNPGVCAPIVRFNSAAHPGNAALDLGLKDSFTIAGWFYFYTTNGDRMILGSTGPGEPGTLYFGTRNGRVLFGNWVTELAGNIPVPTFSWVHLAATYNSHGGQVAIYVNGFLDTSVVGRTNPVKDSDVTLGTFEALPGSGFDGFMDDFSIHCVALSPNQIIGLVTGSTRPDANIPTPSANLPAPLACGWSVREVWMHTNALALTNLLAAEFVAVTPQLGRSTNYESLVISRQDPESAGPGGNFPGALAYRSNNRTPQGLINGNDDLFVLAAYTVIEIGEADVYRFGFSSDDGARLRIKGAAFTNSLSTQRTNPAAPPHRGDTLIFPESTQLSDTIGSTYLLPGRYEVEFLMWEGYNHAFCEVFASRGNGAFTLLQPTTFAATRLSVVRSNDVLTLSWSPTNNCQQLQVAPTVMGPWLDWPTRSNPQSFIVPTHAMIMDPFQVVPIPSPTPGTGHGLGNLVLQGSRLYLTNLCFGGLSGAVTSIHIHGSNLGSTGPQLYNLSFTATPAGGDGCVTTPFVELGSGAGPFSYAELRQQLASGRWYIDIHTTTYPGGEIRGQIRPDGTQFFRIVQ